MNSPVPSTPTLVRFFEDRAEVTRAAKAELQSGRQWLRIADISPLVDERSVQAACKGATVLAARVFRRVKGASEFASSEIAALEAQHTELARKIEAAEQVRSRHEARLEYLGELYGAWASGIAKVPRFSIDAPLESWTSAQRDLCAQDAEELNRLLACNLEIEQLSEKQSELQGELSALRGQNPRHEAFIEVYLDASSAGPAEITVIYRVPSALWRPEHAARLDLDPKQPGKARITLTTFAVVWQRTGENWEGVNAAFSTARPAQVATPPLLGDDNLSKRKKTPEEKQKIVVEAREQTIERASDAKAPEMPGVDDGGEPLEFAPKSQVRLPGTGQPLRVEIARVELSADVATVLMAERATQAHLRAQCVNAGKTPLLAGPIRMARGASLIGRSRLDFVGAGESFELGFGPEDGLRCKRRQDEKRETGLLMGGQTVTREVALYLSNLSSEARELQVIERVPVSEIEGLEVRAPEPKEWTPDKDGFMKRTITLEPNATKELKYKYELRAKSNVVLP
ncbi:hypothetical protein PLCT2_02868 [Planctomycetaceae bacterium]|nr:hypothetical protein PLCT2_02868 [Planctomycetaceae bacterium]